MKQEETNSQSNLKVIKGENQDVAESNQESNQEANQESNKQLYSINKNELAKIIAIKIITEDNLELYLSSNVNEDGDMGLCNFITEKICLFKNKEDAESVINDIKNSVKAKEIVVIDIKEIQAGMQLYEKMKIESENEKDKHFVRVLNKETKEQIGYVVYESSKKSFGVIKTRGGASYWDKKEEALDFVEKYTPHLKSDVELQYEFFPGLKKEGPSIIAN